MVQKTSLKYNILLVDDYPPVRQMVKKLIEASPELQVIGELSNGRDLVKFLKKYPAQMVVLDISMPAVSGFEAARKIKADCPSVKILIVTIHNYKEYVDRALALGVEGYLLKEEVDVELLPAITSLRQGGTFISSRLAV